MYPTKVCTKCKIEKPLDEFYIGQKNSWCKSCQAESRKRWRQANPDRVREQSRKNNRDRYTRLKLKFIAAYGGSCTCCGESDPHFLTVEHKTPEAKRRHVHPGGRPLSGLNLLRRLEVEEYPEDVTCLCMNCNYARGHYGFCPHSNGLGFPHKFPFSFEAKGRRY